MPDFVKITRTYEFVGPKELVKEQIRISVHNNTKGIILIKNPYMVFRETPVIISVYSTSHPKTITEKEYQAFAENAKGWNWDACHKENPHE